MNDTLPSIPWESYLYDRKQHTLPRRFWLECHFDCKMVDGKPYLSNQFLSPIDIEQYDRKEAVWREEFIRWRQACIDQNTIKPDMRGLDI